MMLACLLNHTVIEVTSEFVTVRNGPMPWWGNRTLPIEKIEAAEAFIKREFEA